MLALRTIYIAGLTETAAANTAAHELEDRSVLGHADKGHQRGVDKVCAVQHGHDETANGRGSLGTERFKGRKRPVFPIAGFIEGRHINTGQGSRFFEERDPVAVRFLVREIEIQELIIDDLSLSHVEQVKEGCNRLRIIGTGAAADYNRIAVTAVRGAKRNLREF